LTLDDRRPASLALRLLILGRTLALADAQELLVTALLQSLIEAGLLIKVQHGLRFPLRLELVNQLMVVSDRHDHDPATVMAVGGSTQLLARAGYPQYRPGPGLRQRPAGIAVGAGLPPRGGHRYQPARTAAGALQRGAQRYRQRRVAPGAPVRTRGRERFDLIVSQPPFLPRPDEQAAVLYLHRGTYGDELALALLAGARSRLLPVSLVSASAGRQADLEGMWPPT